MQNKRPSAHSISQTAARSQSISLHSNQPKFVVLVKQHTASYVTNFVVAAAGGQLFVFMLHFEGRLRVTNAASQCAPPNGCVGGTKWLTTRAVGTVC